MGENISCVVFSDSFSPESLKSFNFLDNKAADLSIFLYKSIIKIYVFGNQTVPAYQIRQIILRRLECYYLLPHLSIQCSLYLLAMPSSLSYPATCAALTACLCSSAVTQHA